MKAGSRHQLVVSWPDCSGATTPCGGAEPYFVFSPTSLKIEEHRESIHLAWYSTGGTFRNARGGVAESAASEHALTNEWVAPSTPGDLTIWVVLLDDRGGAGWQTYTLRVEPQ